MTYACVIGDLSLVRALGRRDIPVAVVGSGPGSTVRFSRYCDALVPTPSFVDDPDGAVEALLEWAKGQASPPVVFYQGDHDLLALSRRRSRLSPHVRYVLPRAELVEDLVDKLQFAALAERLSLPVPATRILLRSESSTDSDVSDWDVFPCVVKPAMRTRWFGSHLLTHTISGNQKALHVETRREFDRLLPLIKRHETDFVLQAAVEGGEERILSYHAYVRPGGEVVAEFTGKKVRTAPRRYGLSTYVEITDDPDVKRLGRDVLERLEFSGVVKMDFKQDEHDGRLYLLEINPRFNLWHHPATVAGACIPELVYRDCLQFGSARPSQAVRAGIRWMSPLEDRRSLHEYCRSGELTIGRWLREIVTANVNEDFALHDPLPGLAQLAGIAARKMRRVQELVTRRMTQSEAQ